MGAFYCFTLFFNAAFYLLRLAFSAFQWGGGVSSLLFLPAAWLCDIPPQIDARTFTVIFYFLTWAVFTNGCIRRGKQPLLRGSDWFFSVPVQSGFYSGAGRKLLLGYRLRMLIPFSFYIPLSLLCLFSRRLVLLSLLVLGVCAFIHINHVYSVAFAERQARPFAVAGTEKPVAAISSSLAPRRLRDYTNFRFESALLFLSLLPLAWLLRDYFTAPAHQNLRTVFVVPLLCFYVHLGALYIKRVVLAWRASVPQDCAAEYLEVREKTRRFYLLQCDIVRAFITAQIILWPFELNASLAELKGGLTVWFAALLIFGVVLTFWIEIRRKQLSQIASRTRPVTFPDFLQERQIARWPVCFASSAPRLVLNGARGYSLNLAHALAYLGLAYVAGFAVLIALLRLSG